MSSYSADDIRFLLVSRLAPIHFSLQQIQAPVNSPDYLEQINLSSKLYLQNIKDIAEMTKDPSLDVLIEIWELIEILIIDVTISGSFRNLLEKLLGWSNKNNTIMNELELKAFQSEDQFNCPEYWDLIASNLLCGELKRASDLIKHHPDFSENNSRLYNVFSMIDSRPTFADYARQSYIDFEPAFEHWQNEVIQMVERMDFEGQAGLEKIVGILVGDEITLDSCLPLVGQWYRLLISKCFFLCPATDPRIMINSSQFETQKDDNNVLLELIQRIFELDTTQVIRDLVSFSDSWWFVAHIADLLSKLEPEDELVTLRRNFITQYGEHLIKNKDTWYYGLKYLSILGDTDYEQIEHEILNYDIKNDKDADMLCLIPYRLNLPNANYLQNQLAAKYANQLLDAGQRGSALCWAIRAKDENTCTKISDLEIEHFHKTEEWSIPSIVEAIECNESKIYSEKLFFLSRYKQFYCHVRSQEYFEAAEGLISILSCQMSSEIQSIVLKQALLLLDEDITFSRDQIICIMRALQKQKESSRLQNVKLNPTELEQANLLRKSLADHLSQSIIQTSR